MKILMVASEAVPFAKTGGLADVAGVLPKFIRKLGHDIRVVIPYYACVRERAGEVEALPGSLGVPMGIMGEQWGEVLKTTLPGSDVPIYFIKYDAYYERPNLYNEPSGDGYLDNDNRFVFLSRAALQLCLKLDFTPDIVHVNDWHTAVVPVFMNTIYRHNPHFQDAASVLTIHNMEYQGRYYAGLMDVLGVGWEHFNHLELEWNNQVNLLKGGIYHSTLFNAVSPSYAEEIKTPAFGHGLQGVVLNRQDALRGIINGIDYTVWNPAIDPLIAQNYDVSDMQGKQRCKAELQRRMGLEQRPERPIFGFIARLVEQKGIQKLAAIIDAVMRWDLQFVLLGTGEYWAHAFFSDVAARYPGKFSCYIGYNEELAHVIEAGSDFFVMPSRFEPCGLNQLYSMRYGTLPVVHAVGGLNDTVENCDFAADRGTGFKYYHDTTDALYNTIGWALDTWYNRRNDYERTARRAMQQRFGWEDSAEQYVEMYTDALQRRRG